MTLKRLMIGVGVLALLAGAGIAWLWQVAYSPQGRAKVILAQLKGDTSSTQGWLLKHHLIRPGFAEPAPSEFLYRYERHLRARSALLGLGHDVLPVVIDAFGDDDSEVREVAFDVCGLWGDPAAIQPLVAVMRAPKRFPQEGFDADAWEQAIFTIGSDACGPLRQLLEDPQCKSRAFVVRALGRLKDHLAVDILIRHLKDSDERARTSAADALARIGDPKAVNPLIDALEDPQGNCRYRAAEALRTFKDKRATAALLRHLFESDERDANTRSSALHALGELGDPKAFPALSRILSKDISEHWFWNLPIAASMARAGNMEGRNYIKAALNSDDPSDRQQAVATLADYEIRGASDLLLLMLYDADPSVYVATVESLRKLHVTQAIPEIKRRAQDPNPKIRHAVAKALEDLHAKTQPASGNSEPRSAE